MITYNRQNTKSILLIILLFNFTTTIAQVQRPKNVSGDNPVKHTQLFYFNISEKITEEYARDFFKPYLSYKSKSGSYHGSIMDSFLFLDLSYQNNGIYEKNEWNNYLDNIFIRTKLPLITEGLRSKNKKAYIGKSNRSSISQKICLNNRAKHLIIKGQVKLEKTNKTEISNRDLIIGVEFYDKNKDHIVQWGNYSESLKMTFSYVNIDHSLSSWQNISAQLSIPPTAVSAKVHILNWEFKQPFWVDNIYISNENGTSYLDKDESGFNTPLSKTNWEYQKKVSKKYLFDNRNPLCTELNMATCSLFPQSDKRIKLILTIPEILPENYNTADKKAQLKAELNDFVYQTANRYKQWKEENPEHRIDILGFYYIDENIRIDEVPFYSEIFKELKQTLEPHNWVLFSSPYNGFFNCKGSSSYADEILPLFQIVWQQPNSFFNSRYGNIDRDLLQYANEFMSEKNLAVNIENRVVAPTEEYGRINDYFDYGEKYGYINYSKLYYDDAGAHYENANSNDYKKRIDYDNLYKFIQLSHQGVIVNGSFEDLVESDSTKFHYWNGIYSIDNNKYSFSNPRKVNLITNAKTPIRSLKYPISPNLEYSISFALKAAVRNKEKSKASIGIRFYNCEGEIIEKVPIKSNLQYSEETRSYIKYFQPDKEIHNYTIKFQPPANALFFDFFIQKIEKVEMEWQSMHFSSSENSKKRQLIYQKADSPYLEIEKDNTYGNHSLKLSSGQHAFSKEKTSINSNTPYYIKYATRQSGEIGKEDKVWIAFELYDTTGNKIKQDLKIPFFEYSSELELHFIKLDNFTNRWKNTEHLIHFPSFVGSFIIHLKNINSNSPILFDNITIETQDNLDLDRTIGENNLLVNKHWSMKPPLIVGYQKPIQYLDFVKIPSCSGLSFSAILKGADHHSGTFAKNVLAIEFYDNNYNQILSTDINTKLHYSKDYKYWILNLPNITSMNCEDYFEQDKDRQALPNWYNNQWESISETFSVPKNARYFKLSFHRLAGEGHYKILNPQVTCIK